MCSVLVLCYNLHKQIKKGAGLNMAAKAESFIGVMVFDEWEIKWMEQALTKKMKTEQNRLHFLQDTFELADDYSLHWGQICLQQEILAAHGRLLEKFKDC